MIDYLLKIYSIQVIFIPLYPLGEWAPGYLLRLTKLVMLMYGKSIFIVKDGKVYDIGFTTEPLKVPEMRPVGEKIIQSFQFTNNTSAQ
jgi:hypothetical protein